ncbi:MAG: hypothetical protein ABWY28_15765, partial [Pseudomonas prosekii]
LLSYFAFQLFNYDNEASGHLNHKPVYQYMPLRAAGLGPINGLEALLTGLCGLRVGLGRHRSNVM